MRVVTIPMAAPVPDPDGEGPGIPALPIIPSAELVKKEANSGWYSAHFDPVSKRWIMLYELPWAAGTFLADANDDGLMRALPPGEVFDARKWKLWEIEAADDSGSEEGSELVGQIVELRTVPTRDASDAEPWTVDGRVVTRARPVMRSRCGHVRSVVLAER